MEFSEFLLVSFLLMLNFQHRLISPVSAKSKVHIVYMGESQHHDPDRVTESHHETLASVLGSKEAALDSIVYSYRHGFSGFAAKLTESQVQEIAGLSGVLHVMPNHFYSLQTTRSWDFLGLSSGSANNLLHQTDMGDGVIVGVIDSGIWPESESFNDEGLGPVPSHWKGNCTSGDQFNGSVNCNKKLVGAKWFVNGFLAERDQKLNTTGHPEFFSPRDALGHGTHVSSIAAGSIVRNVSYKGLAFGAARGGAPRARIAMYKACWNVPSEQCSSADLLKAFDEAMHDGVDLLSLSLGVPVPLYSDVDARNPIAIASFHAITKGIPVICAGGNALLPFSRNVLNTAPWLITVAATSMDRAFPTAVTLGNNKTVLGQSLYTGNEIGFTGLVYPESPRIVPLGSSYCESLSFNISVKGKIVLCFASDANPFTVITAASAVREAGGVGVIVAKNPGNVLIPNSTDDFFPNIVVDYELGTQILFYIRSTRYPIIKISPSKTLTGKPIATKVAFFSCRGPNSAAPEILKPDIAAPGVNILGAMSPLDSSSYGGFAFKTGTSMATPHVSGVVALLKALHPHWSPAAIRSAIVTTAWKSDPKGEPMFSEGAPSKLGDPFDYGGGLINPLKASQPGLIYEISTHDYIKYYLCPMGYNDSSISHLLQHPTTCPEIPNRPSILDLNLPSITIPNLKETVSITRKVTNVGPVDSIYRAMVEPPFGVEVTVTPQVLAFSSAMKTLCFNVTFSSSHHVNNGYYFGSLTWTDGKHFVTTPLSVRTQILESYVDDY